MFLHVFISAYLQAPKKPKNSPKDPHTLGEKIK